MKFYCFKFSNHINIVNDLIDLFSKNIVSELLSVQKLIDNSYFIFKINEFHTHSEIKDIILMNSSSNVKFLIDDTWEGNANIGFYIPIFKWMHDNNINPNSFLILTNNSVRDGIVNYTHDGYNFSILHYPSMLNKFLVPYGLEGINRDTRKNDFLKENIFFDRKQFYIKNPTVDFLILNRSLKDFKLKLLYEFFNRGKFDKVRYSLLNTHTSFSNDYSSDFKMQILDDNGEFKKITLPDENYYSGPMDFMKINHKWSYDCKVNVITESIFENESINYDKNIHLSEKTWRCIFLGVPFVLSSTKNSLNSIKKYGFKTFESVIDESYDTAEDDIRIAKVVDAAISLSKVWNSDEVNEICEYNRNLYLDKAHKKEIIKKLFINNLENWK